MFRTHKTNNASSVSVQGTKTKRVRDWRVNDTSNNTSSDGTLHFVSGYGTVARH